MILPLAGLILGAIAGAFAAHRRGGTRADIAQWAAVWGIGLGAAGVLLTVLLLRLTA